MKNLFRKIRWRKLLRRLIKGALRVALALVGVLVLAVVLLDLYCEGHGLPSWAMEMIQGELVRRGVQCDMREVRAGLLSSVVVENGTFTVRRNGMDVVLNADRLKARIGLHALLSGQPFLKTLDVSGATLGFRSRKPDTLLPQVADFSAELRPQAGGAYAINARGLVEGVSMRVSGRIRNSKALWKRRPPTDTQDDRLAQALETVTRSLRQCRFGSRDAAFEAEVDADAEDWTNVAVTGHWNVSDVVLQGTLAQTFKGQFTASRKQIVLRELLVRLNREEHLFGKVVLEPGSNRVWAEVEGQCVPATAFRLINVSEPSWLERLHFASPVGFRTVLHPSPLRDRRRWHLDVDCEASGFALRDMPVKHLAARVVLRDRTIDVPSFAWEVGNGTKPESAVGKVTVWPAEKCFTLDLDASLDWSRRCRELGLPLPVALQHLDTGSTPPEVHLALERSPYDWKQWHGKASVRTARASYAGAVCSDLRSNVYFGGDTVRVEDLHMQFGTPGTAVAGRIEARLPGQARERLQIDYDLSATARDGGATASLVAMAGSVLWHPETGMISGRGEGTSRMARAFTALGPALGLHHLERIGQFHCLDKPVQVRFTLPECQVGSRNWRVNADVKAEDIRHRELRIKEVETTMSLSWHQISFAGLRGTTATGEEFGLNLGLSFSPFTVSVSDGRLLGSPFIVETFIEDRQQQRNYRRIWRDFVWDADHPPQFHVPSLLYRHDPEAGGWHLEIQGDGVFDEVVFHGVRAKRLTLDTKLDLPGTISVNNVVFATDQAVLKGDVQLNLDGVPSCDFRIATEEGGCDPRVVIRMIGPHLEEHLDSMEFAADSNITCSGSFFLAKDPRLSLAGTLETKRWHWGKVDLADVTAKWGVRDSEVRWDIAKATCCKGAIQSTGVYDPVTRVGDLAIECSDASLNATMDEFGLGTPKPEHEAKLALSGRVRFLREWAGRPVQLTGTGQVIITEGDLWRVPILSQLGDLLDVPLLRRLSRGGTLGLGRITALRADLMFDGERISVPNLVTDGTVISLNGSGEYSWRTDRIEFDIVGEAFRRYGLLTIVARPLSWVFNAQLSGTRSDYKWRLNNALKRAIIGDGDAEKRRIDDP